jgi:alpha-beta hydrolase superfamily lysophospholipase
LGHHRVTLKLDSGLELPGESTLRIALDVHYPDAAALGPSPLAWFCLPGGGMKRGYFDLSAENDDSFSFARAMVARGFIVVTIDHPGIGDSDRPADGYALTVDLVARSALRVTEGVRDGLRQGNLVPGLPALPDLRSVGIGHSMGAMITTVQQSLARQHAAIALLGFSTRGLPEYVPADVRELLAQDPAALHARMAEFARKSFVVPYPVIKPSRESAGIYAGANAETAGILAVKKVGDALLPVAAWHSMLPGNVAAEAARIDVPVFLGLGELDMAGPPHQVPAAFPASRDVTLSIFPGTGHSHFLFPTRMEVFRRLDAWARSVII